MPPHAHVHAAYGNHKLIFISCLLEIPIRTDSKKSQNFHTIFASVQYYNFMVSRRNFLRLLSAAAQPRSMVLQAIADIPPAELPPMPTQEFPQTGAILAKMDDAHEALTAVFANYFTRLNATPQPFTEDLRPQLEPFIESARQVMTLTMSLNTGNDATNSEIRKTLGGILEKHKKAYLDQAGRVLDAAMQSPAMQKDYTDALEITGPNAQKRNLTSSMLDAMELHDKGVVLGNLKLKNTSTIAAAIGAIRETSKQWGAAPVSDAQLRTDLNAVNRLVADAEIKFGLPQSAIKRALALGSSDALTALAGKDSIAELVSPKILMQKVAKAVGKAVDNKVDDRWTDEQHAQTLAALQAQFSEVVAKEMPNTAAKGLPLPELYKHPKAAAAAVPTAGDAGVSAATAATALVAGAALLQGLTDKPADAATPKEPPAAAPATPDAPLALPEPDRSAPTIFGTHTGDIAKERVEQKKGEPGQGTGK